MDEKLHKLPNELQKLMQDEAAAMDGIGVQSVNDHKNFMYIQMHLPKIASELNGGKSLDREQLAKVSSFMFNNLDDFPIDSVFHLFLSVENALKHLGFSIKKMAYPQDYNTIYVYPSYNIKKWLQTMRDIYSKMQKGFERSFALNSITANWDKMEKNDFKHWMSFYEEGAHKKYVTASMEKKSQLDQNYLIPLNNLKAKLPSAIIPTPDMEDFQQVQQLNSAEEKKKIIEEQRARITGRLNAAEKLLCSTQGIIFAGKEFDAILQALHNLKRQVQTANKLAISSSLFEDLIIRTGNLLNRDGKVKSAALIYKIAQVAEPIPELPTDDKKDPYETFLKGLDIDHEEDENKSDDELVVEAQAAPVNNVVVPNIKKPEEDPIEQALGTMHINDVLKRLESLANIFKTREIARQLSIVDLMMDKLGIGAYFPELGEAIKSALDSNSYCSSRIEGILNKIRGQIDTPLSRQIDLEGDKNILTPETADLAKGLDIQKEKDNARKARRKAEEEIQATAPPAITNAPEQLSAPANIEKTTPTPVPAPV